MRVWRDEPADDAAGVGAEQNPSNEHDRTKFQSVPRTRSHASGSAAQRRNGRRVEPLLVRVRVLMHALVHVREAPRGRCRSRQAKIAARV